MTKKKTGVLEKRSREDIISDIKLLIATKGYIYALAEIVSRDFFVDGNDIANIEWRERLHSNEVAYLMGMMLKNNAINSDEIDAKQIEEAIGHTRRLLDELHRTYMYDFGKDFLKHTPEQIAAMSDEEKEEEFKETFSTKEMIVETTFYGDTGFYDVQTFDMAEKLYAHDQQWISDNTKFSTTKARAIFFTLKHMFNGMHFARFSLEDDDEAKSLRAIDELAFPLNLIVETVLSQNESITKDDVKAFLDLFSCNFGDQLEGFNEPGNENIFTYKPIINFGHDIYFFPNTMFLASAIYKSPLYWMRQDDQYVNTANKHIGDVTEDITYDYFKSIFSDANTYEAIKIVKGRNTVTDIDVMGVIGNTVVIAQNKSKKMTAAALNGDTDAIRSDFQKAVIDPYEQGIKVRDILLGNDPYKLIDKTGNQITLPDGIEHAYILCVSNEPYPAIMDQSRSLLSDINQLPPIQLSLFDLDLMAEYFKDPYEFVFYLKQRLENHEGIISSNELIHLGYHLKHGLFMPKGANMLLLDQSFGQYIDADYYHKKMGTPKPSKKDALFDSWENKEYKKLVDTLKQANDPSTTDIIFFLMTIPHNIADVIMRQIKQANDLIAKDSSKLHDFSMPITNNGQPWGGITYIIGRDPKVVIPRLRIISSMNKYRAKAGMWLALGADTDGNIGCIAFASNPWAQADDMDEALDFYEKNTHGRQIEINHQDEKVQ